MDKTDLDITRGRIFELYEFLSAKADADDYVSMMDIKNCLKGRMGLGDIDRRTISRDLFLLNSITKLSVEYDNKARAYRVSTREKLSAPELSIVINAALSARFDSEQETRTLADKLYSLAGYAKMPSGAHQVKSRIKLGEGADTLDKLDALQKAIDQNLKVLFDYRKYTLNKRFEVVRTDCRVSPYKILWQNDSLYLVGNYLGNDFSHYRLERICNLRVTKETRKPIGDIIGIGKFFDEAEYLRRAVGLSQGDVTRVFIRFQNSCIGEVLDNLGKDVYIRDNGDGRFTLNDNVALNKKFTRWILGFGPCAEVIKPDSLRNEVADALKSAGDIYKRAT